MTDVIYEPARQTPVMHSVDVVVAGGGTAGVSAAVTASRMGLSVVMVERSAIPGGMVTHVTQWLNDFENKGGFAREFLDHLQQQDICAWPYYNPFLVVPYFDDLLDKEGVRYLYLANVVAPILEDGRLAGLHREGRGGHQPERGAAREGHQGQDQ